MAPETNTEVYQLHVWICQISPMIWRRLLVRSDSTIAELHYTLQIAFDWSDEHLNLFHIHSRDYGVYHDGGASFSLDPNQVWLSDFQVPPERALPLRVRLRRWLATPSTRRGTPDIGR
jgi:Plasmid pRiA4b ORF-3-like protein